MAEPIPSLNVLTAACVAAKNLGWNREEVRQAMVAHQARWKDGQLTEVPAAQRRRLLSALSHHPSWWRQSAAFCAQLPALNTDYAELCTGCESLGWRRPSMMDGVGRKALVALLQDPQSELWSVLLRLREPVQKAAS